MANLLTPVSQNEEYLGNPWPEANFHNFSLPSFSRKTLGLWGRNQRILTVCCLSRLPFVGCSQTLVLPELPPTSVSRFSRPPERLSSFSGFLWFLLP